MNSTEMTLGTGWSTTGASGTSGDAYISTTAPATAKSRYNFSSAESTWFNVMPVHCFALCYATHASITATLELSPVDPSKVTVISDSFAPTTLNEWAIIDVGLLNTVGIGVTSQHIRIDVDGSSGTFRLDGIWMFPTEEYITTPLELMLPSSGVNPSFDGNNKRVTIAGGGYSYSPATVGTMWTAKAGQAMTRYIYHLRGDNATDDFEPYDLTDSITINTFTITPRTRHLLGTA